MSAPLGTLGGGGRATAPVRPHLQLPEPGRFWIRASPRSWPAPAGAWIDLASGGLGASTRQPIDLAAWLALKLDDVWYLPPVESSRGAERQALAERLLARGTPIVWQALPGDPPPPSGAVAIYDLLPALLQGAIERLSGVGQGATAVWPLIAGVTDDPSLWRAACERLVAAGATCVQALALELTPADRRLLAAHLDERAFARLFHAPPPPERDFAAVAHAHGLKPFVPRPLPRPPLAGATNRWLAATLGLVGDLWLRLGRPMGRGQAYYRAMRWLDRSPRDIEALRREGNLGVLPWLDPESRRVVEDMLEHGRSRLLEALLAEYVGDRPR